MFLFMLYLQNGKLLSFFLNLKQHFIFFISDFLSVKLDKNILKRWPHRCIIILKKKSLIEFNWKKVITFVKQFGHTLYLRIFPNKTVEKFSQPAI